MSNNTKMKNMIVLKDLPSNLIEEAIIVLKANQKIKKFNLIQKDGKQEEKSENNGYILKEAELIISNYISKNEKNDKLKYDILNRKHKKLKIVLGILSAVSWLELLLLVI